MMSKLSVITSAAPIPASTVVLVRPSKNGGFEVFMNRRPEGMQTYAGAYVFPGGCVEGTDYSREMTARTHGLAPGEARALLKADMDADVCLGHWVAAARELFEEAGVHFFIRVNRREEPHSALLLERLLSRRSALQSGEVTLPALLDAEQLCCDVSRLAYFFHRITPEHYKVRFDTRFFLAALPPDQEPLDSSEEVAESLWITPEAALMRLASGTFPMMPPTVAVLRLLAEQGSWDSLCSAFEIRPRPASSRP
jgi:8-oxo-dGTP pyrophosphatase MutT (NUDIX family)